VEMNHASQSSSFEYQYKSDDDNENNQLSEIVVMYHQILTTDIKSNVWQTLRRINKKMKQ